MSSSRSNNSTAPRWCSRADYTSTPPSLLPCSSRPSAPFVKGCERSRSDAPRPPSGQDIIGADRAPARTAGGRPARPGAPDRVHQGDGRRLRFLQERVQPRGAGAAAAGSAFKPFVYIAALESGMTPASTVEDSPVEYPAGKNGKPWKPDNYDRKFRGPITYQQALEESINVATVKVQEQVGIRRTIDVARRLGVESPLRRESLARSRKLGPDIARIDLGLRGARQPGRVDATPRPSGTCSTRSKNSSRKTLPRARRCSRRKSPT